MFTSTTPHRVADICVGTTRTDRSAAALCEPDALGIAAAMTTLPASAELDLKCVQKNTTALIVIPRPISHNAEAIEELPKYDRF